MEGNDTLTGLLSTTQSVNVICPTWFILTDNAGNFSSLASESYVSKAHEMGLEVWGLISNLSDSVTVDMYELLSRTSTRTYLIENLVSTALAYGLDGINIDFEHISDKTGEAFIEFIRELSIP